MDEYGRGTVELRGDRDALIEVAVPLTEAAMERGLQGFDHPGPDGGMLFLSHAWPDPETISMWMATVQYPLAMIWISDDATVADIVIADPGDRGTYSRRGVAVLEASDKLPEYLGLRPGSGALVSVFA